MFIKNRSKRTFNFQPTHQKKDMKIPLNERIKMTSLSSVSHKNIKSRIIIKLVLLAAILAAIYYLGLPDTSLKTIKIDKNEIKKVR